MKEPTNWEITIAKIREADPPPVKQWLDDIRKGIRRPYPESKFNVKFSLN